MGIIMLKRRSRNSNTFWDHLSLTFRNEAAALYRKPRLWDSAAEWWSCMLHEFSSLVKLAAQGALTAPEEISVENCS